MVSFFYFIFILVAAAAAVVVVVGDAKEERRERGSRKPSASLVITSRQSVVEQILSGIFAVCGLVSSIIVCVCDFVLLC